MAAVTENIDICISAVEERLPASAGVVLPANALTGHRNVTAKISFADFLQEFRVDRGHS